MRFAFTVAGSVSLLHRRELTDLGYTSSRMETAAAQRKKGGIISDTDCGIEAIVVAFPAVPLR
jgi:hypothetical protein